MELIDKKVVLETYPFNVESLTIKVDGRELPYPYYRLQCADWVNVLPITSDGRAVLIRQHRAGAMRSILETPGGMIDQHETRDPTMAAVRELEEETGFTSQRVLSLGSLNPNPAIMTNRCHFFVALACMPAIDRKHFPDAEERISVELVPVAELEGLVRTGQIDHGLCALCIMLAGKYLGKA